MGRKRKWPYFCTFPYLKGFVCVLGTLHDRVEKKYCDVKSLVLDDLLVSTKGMTSQFLGDGLGRTTPAGPQVVLIFVGLETAYSQERPLLPRESEQESERERGT